jgi:FkbH-like protein
MASESSTSAEFRVGVAADFNAMNFCSALRTSLREMQGECEAAPFGQVLPLLHDRGASFWQSRFDAIVVWTLPEMAVPEFGKALDWMPFSLEQLEEEVDAFAALVQEIPNAPLVLLPTWDVPAYGHGLGPLELRNQVGVKNTLLRMNLRLADRLSSSARVVLFDAQPWREAGAPQPFSPRLWYRSRTPYNDQVFAAAAGDMAATLAATRGKARKLIILDLDNTLWGGEVGDVGWENVRLGGHDPIGEAFVDFQRALKRLIARGILLAIVSKNEESAALTAVEKHPEMVLRPDDFAGWRVDWNDKAQNIDDLLTSLNLGREAAVFLDDSPFERARVQEALPGILVPELPADPLSLPSFVRGLRCFDTLVLSKEDRARTASYVADRKRAAAKSSYGSLEGWLRDLGLRISVGTAEPANMSRLLQLFQRTNQMNLSTRRLSAVELEEWLRAGNRSLWTFTVADRFGDYGLCGVASTDEALGRVTLQDFLVSCRVLGRGVEETMLAVAAQHAARLGYETLHAEFVRTARNTPCEKWLVQRPSVTRQGDLFSFELNAIAAAPDHVQLAFNSDAQASSPSPA